MTLSVPAIARARLQSQQIASTRITSIGRLVGWMGAMQAQDFPSVKWAVGVRLPHCTDQDVEQALSKGEIVRTHLLRPTWHLVARDDVRWMLDLTAPRLKSSLRSRHRELELTPQVVRRSHAVIEKSLRDGTHADRKSIVDRLEMAGIPTDENRASHLLMLAELDGIVCSGPTVRGRPTYALLDERVPSARPVPKDEALARLAGRYFSSRAPATLEDFTWWSGFTASDAKRALQAVEDGLRPEALGPRTYWVPKSFPTRTRVAGPTYLLPAYDEYTICYRDRSATLPTAREAVAVSSNGIFYPLVVRDGRAVATWKRTRGNGFVAVQPKWFWKPDVPSRDLLERGVRRYSRFLQCPVRLQE